MNERLRRQAENDAYLANRKSGEPVRRLPSISRLPMRTAPPPERDDLRERAEYVLAALETSGLAKPRYSPLTVDELERGSTGADFQPGDLP